MANEQSNAQTRILYQKYNLKRDDVYASERQGYQIITRSGIEKIQYQESISVSFEVIKAEPKFCCVKAIATKDNRKIETLAAATKGFFKEKEVKKRGGGSFTKKSLEDGNTDSWYVVEMAEKRALARAILKITGLYEHGFFGEDENEEDFKPKSETNKNKAQGVIDDIIDGK